ncbi:HipA family kinase [Paraburkholderia atlantica]|uniref:HipA family kinase n=1 Tax=Paraburkholderia atlantica TaxID=2654982 RepID=UPI00288BDC03|nr:HipA family kinase [Paraburkholderia atlantica]
MFNPEVVQIAEILGRATQGITRPFICRGEDEQLYFVKGRHAGRRSLVAEWLGSSMAAAFGLPVAPFRIAQVQEELINVGPPHFADLFEDTRIVADGGQVDLSSGFDQEIVVLLNVVAEKQMF